MVADRLLEIIKSKSKLFMPYDVTYGNEFPVSVCLDRLLINGNASSIPDVLALTEPKGEKNLNFVWENADYENGDTKSFDIFKDDVHGHLIYFKNQLASLSKHDNKTILNVQGEELAKFKEEVYPQIIETSSGDFVSLAKNRQDIQSINSVKYPGFDVPVFQNLEFLSDENYAAMVYNENNSVIIKNDEQRTILGVFPTIKGFDTTVGRSDYEEYNTGRFIRIGSRFVGIDFEYDQTIMHTLKENETDGIFWQGDQPEIYYIPNIERLHTPYGIFPFPVEPTTLSLQERTFIAVDRLVGKQVLCVRLYDASREETESIEDLDINSSNKLLMIPYAELEKIIRSEYRS